VLTKTPFLTGFSALLCGRSKTRKQALLQGQHDRLLDQSPDGLCTQLATEITPELIDQHNHTRRRRVYPHDVTFWAFLSQTISPDGSCARAVAQVQQWMRSRQQPVPSAATTSYVDARQALPLELLQAVHQSLCDQLDRSLGADARWRGFPVKAIDGTSVQIPDSPANRATYPLPSGQTEGCGFPVVSLVGLIDLNHGGLRDFAQSSVHTGEMRGYDQLEDCLESGDLFLGDRLYSSYEVVGRLQNKGVHFIGRNHQSRKLDFRCGTRIGPNERLQTWRKPKQQPPQSRLSAEQWAALPDTLTMRIIRSHGPDRQGRRRTRYVVTTLLDAEAYPAQEIIGLYAHRWDIELRFRDIKTTMGMELLRTQSPAMVEKELMMHLIAYNVIRLLMLKAGQTCGVNHRRISFKGVIQVLEETRAGFEQVSGRPRRWQRERDNLLERIGEREVRERPGRNEPRKKKRRPKSYGWLQRPRHAYFEHFRSDDTPLKILDQPA